MAERQGGIPPIEKEEKITYYPPTEVMVKKYQQEKPTLGISTRKVDLAENQDALKKIFEKQGIVVAEGEKIDVLNPTNEFEIDGEAYMAGRAEPRKSKFDPRTIFFKKVGEHWEPQPEPVFKLEDPSITKIGDEFVLCGVEIKLGIMSRFRRLIAGDKVGIMVTSWKTAFYKGKNLDNLVRFTEGPDGMKDVRLVQLPDGKIGVYTRPQGLKKGLWGQIGFTIIDKLSDLNAQVNNDAPLLSTRFPVGEWGGVNEATPLPDGRIFVLGHRAYYEMQKNNKKIRHYYPWAFIHDPKTGEIIDLGILAERKDCPTGPAKRDDLIDILFSAGVKFLGQNRLSLLVGMSDLEIGEVERDIPQGLTFTR